MAVRALRGATQIEVDDRAAIVDATVELVGEVLGRNGLTSEDVISILFTTTADLVAEFPASAVRTMGITDVPLMCASEISVPGSMPRVIRMMAHVEAEFTKAEAHHVYLRGTGALRTDLPAG